MNKAETLRQSYDREIKLGLERITELLDLMGNPQDSLKFIHVAGTNGKGSVCAMTSEILIRAGYKTGLFTSPAIFEYREQFKINNQNIGETVFEELSRKVKHYSGMMQDEPSEFESAVALAFLYFAQEKCDFVVLEVGMGGSTDATNVIKKAEVAVITSIDYDHTAYLGNSLLDIAEKKAGIIKENSHVVIGPQEGEVLDYLLGECEKKHCRYSVVKNKDIVYGNSDRHDADPDYFDYGKYRGIRLGLMGIHQYTNAAIVLEIINILQAKGYVVSEESIRKGLETVSWPGRFQKLADTPLFIIDGAHNPHGIRALTANLDYYYPGEKFTFIVGILKDKDYSCMLRDIMPRAEAFVTVEPNNARALTAAECKWAIEKAGFHGKITDCDSFEKAIETAFSDRSSQVCAFGSLYSVNALTEAWTKYRQHIDME